MIHPRIDEGTRVLVLTGAGVSAESGLPTFRDAGGLWEHHRVEEIASPDGFRDDPRRVWRFYSQRRAGALRCGPNAGHRALASLEARLGDHFLLATQNVDGLHARAGSIRMVELHGNLFRTRCSRCSAPPFSDEREYLDEPPTCAACSREGTRALLRPDIVWFGEQLDEAHLRRVEAFMAAASGARWVFLAVGTSGVVYPAAGLVSLALRHAAETWLVNAEPADNRARFAHFVQGKSADLLPELLAD
jgi:NAD-dependent deacetylase